MRTIALELSLLVLLASATATESAGVPGVRQTRSAAAKDRWKVTIHAPDKFNASGNLILAFSEHESSVDVIRELGTDGKIVWECRMPPAGSLTHFVRSADGMTIVAQRVARRYSQITRINRYGEYRGGLALTPGAAEKEYPALRTLQWLPDGRIYASMAGYAFESTLSGTVSREFVHGSLLSAFSLSDGRLLCALDNPNRFALYDHERAELKPLPLTIMCNIWNVARGEETAPDSLRLYGCFCMPGQPQEGIPGERKTIEVLEVDLAGHVSWLYGSPNALRVDEFGTRKCVTYTRQIIRRSGTIPGRIIRLDTYPGNCRVVEEDNDGNVFRQWLSLPPIPNPSVIGLRSCPLIAGQLLE